MLHFLLIGGTFYLGYVLYFKSNSITAAALSNSQIQKIKKEYKEEYRTPIGNVAMKSFVNYKNYENILLNEALSLKIDSNATDVREDAVQKMEYILANSQKIEEPSEEMLREFYKKHLTNYSKREKFSFVQIYFPYDKIDSAKKLLKILQLFKEIPNNGKYYGFVSELPGNFTQITPIEIKKIFGKYFTTKLLYKPGLLWIGPIRSKIGEHLIYITEIKTASPYPFNDVQDRVYTDYMDCVQKESFQNAYKDIARKHKR